MFALLFLIIFLSGAAVLAGLILGIVGLSTDKKGMRNGGFIAFIIGLVVLIFTIIYSVNRAVTKVKENIIEPFEQMADSLQHFDPEMDVTEDVRSYLLSDTCTNVTIKFIREASSKKSPDIKDSYYTYFGSPSYARFPVIYPFAIHCWDSKDYGVLVNEEKVQDIQYNPGNEETVILNIQSFAFDEHFILMQTTSNQDANETTIKHFVLYDLEKKTNREFDTQEALLKAAKKAGYKGNQELISIWDYDTKF